MSVFTAIDESGGSAAGGRLSGEPGAVYATVQSGVGTASSAPFQIDVGQTFGANLYNVYRSGLSFDTSGIGAGVSIASAVLSVYGFSDYSDTDFNLTVVSGADLADPLVDADYQQLLNDTASLGKKSTASFVEGAWFDIPLNAAGIAAINKIGVTRFGLRSSKDISATAPIGSEDINYETSWVTSWPTAHPPKLTVTLQGIGGIMVPARYYILVDWDEDDDFTDAESDITADVTDGDIQAGKDRELGRAVASFMALTVKNSDHKYSPPNTSSVLNTDGNTLRAGHKVIAGISFPYDAFSDSDGVALAAHTPDAPYDPASLWTEVSGTWLIATNKVKETTGAGLAVMETGEKDAHIAVTFTKGANNDGIIVFRYIDSDNYMYVRTDGTNLDVRKVVATVDGSIATGALTWANAATKTIKVILHGTFIYVLADMALIVSATPAGNLTGTKHGIGGPSISANARWDNWGCSYNLFYGTVDRIVPSPGIDARTAYIECSNDFKILAKLKLRRRAYPYSGFPEGTEGFIKEIWVNNASNAAQLGFILDTGQTIQTSTKAWWDVFALEQLYQIESEENGFFYQDPDGLIRFENRGHRAAAPHDAARSIIYSVRATNGIFMTDMKWRSGMEDVINRVTVNYKRSVKQQIEDTALIADVTDEYDLWKCHEADVAHGPVTSSTLTVVKGTPKVIYFEAGDFDAIDGLVDPVSTVVQELIEGKITTDPNVIKEFKLGETVTGSVSGHTGKVQEASSKYILVKLDVADDLFVATDTISGGTSGAEMGATDDLTITDYSDYVADATATNAGGGDMTANLTVALAAVDASDEFNYGKGGKLTLTNDSNTPLYVTWLRVRGHGYKLMDAVGAYVVDTVSEGKYGEGSKVVDSELFTTYDECLALAVDIEGKEDEPRSKIDVVLQNSTKETLMQILARRLSDRVTVTWSAFGVDEDFYINSIKHHIYNGGASIDCVMSLEEVA